MDDKKLWLKISGSITYYFKSYNRKLSNEEIWLDYLDYVLPDMNGDGVHTYLDKQMDLCQYSRQKKSKFLSHISC